MLFYNKKLQFILKNTAKIEFTILVRFQDIYSSFYTTARQSLRHSYAYIKTELPVRCRCRDGMSKQMTFSDTKDRGHRTNVLRGQDWFVMQLTLQ